MREGEGYGDGEGEGKEEGRECMKSSEYGILHRFFA